MEIFYVSLKHVIAKERAVHTRLHHYTSLEALYKIIEDRTILFSTVASMNDPGEGSVNGQYMLNVIKDNIHNYSNGRFSDHPRWSAFCENVFSIDDRISLSPLPHLFCATTLDDNISQWKNYGNNGMGACVSFVMESMFSFDLCSWKECAYEPEKLLDDILYDMERMSDGLNDREAVEWALRRRVLCNIITKHPSYADERERRAVWYPDQNPQGEISREHAVMNGLPREFVLLPYNMESVCAITIGHKHGSGGLQTVRRFLHTHMPPRHDVAIKLSECTFK